METVGGKKLGVKRMGEERIRISIEERGGGVVWDMFSRLCCSQRGNHPFFAPVFPIPDLSL